MHLFFVFGFESPKSYELDLGTPLNFLSYENMKWDASYLKIMRQDVPKNILKAHYLENFWSLLKILLCCILIFYSIWFCFKQVFDALQMNMNLNLIFFYFNKFGLDSFCY